ncbi:sigma-70 family RNA polymerase sigma factor [Paraburkholderia sp. BCC1885]|uniref:sigma-70 family RNA polymerase sigma factor n=1 Tax=Paraburkholderia sp. BCC1885 TaxID=2562669 RepID=UPI0011830F90|nr:sigma-70 family RNA polymerase sigma factor [Paraburkholderia sp. BCC1885]
MGNAQQGQGEFSTTASDASRLLGEEFRRSYGWLKARLWRKTGCQFVAEDLSSEAFVQLVSMQDTQTVREPRALLTTISQRLVFDFWRRRDLENAYLRELAHVPEHAVQSEEEKYQMLQMLIEIDRRLSGLPSKVKLAFIYSQLEGMTYAEIATKLGVSISMVGQYMTKALTHCLQVQSS